MYWFDKIHYGRISFEMNSIPEIWTEYSHIMKPDPPMTVSEWADHNRVLSPGVSSEPGNWQTDRVPYAKEWMDCISTPLVESVTLMVSAQCGKSSVIENIIGYYSSYDPCPVLLVEPTLELCDTISKTRLAPMINDCPILRERYNVKDKDENTLRLKTFRGGALHLVGANSPAGLASRAIRILLVDETDRMPPVLAEEGDILALASARQSTYFNRKSYFVSTPTIKGQSRIESLFQAGDMRHYHIPCPHCNKKFVWMWKQFKFERNEDGTYKENTAHIDCLHCGKSISENWKIRLLARGNWIPDRPSVTRHRSYTLNALCSPWVSWSRLAEEFIDAHKKGPEVLQTFVNLRLGEPWEKIHQGNSIDPEQLLLNRTSEWGKMPKEVLMLTAGLDVQQARIEALVIGWSKNFKTWTIEKRTFDGSPDMPNIWMDVDDFLQKSFEREDGRMMDIDITLIDSGYQTKSVRNFTSTRFNRRIYSSIGRNSTEMFKREKDEQGYPYFVIAVNQLKNLLMTRLGARKDEYGYMSFHRSLCDLEFFKQLTAEHEEIYYERGIAKVRWVQDRPRNEILDMYVYNLAATYIHIPDFDQLSINRSAGSKPSVEEVPVKEAPPQTKPLRRPQQNWMTGYGNT